MGFCKQRRDQGSALLGALLLTVALLAMVLIPLLQISGWTKREQLRRIATEGRMSARIAALRKLSAMPSSRAPQLLAVTGSVQHTEIQFGIELLVSALGTALKERTVKPSWRALAGGRSLHCDGDSRRPSGGFGPRAAQSCTGSHLSLTDEQVVIAANIFRKGEFLLEVEQPTCVVLLGAIELSGALRVEAPGHSVELIALGDVAVESLSVNADSLLVHSAFGTIEMQKLTFDPVRCSPAILLEAENGVEIGSDRSVRFGCPLTRNHHRWPSYELVGERLIPQK